MDRHQRQRDAASRRHEQLRAEGFVLNNDEAYGQEASESESGYMDSGSGEEGSEYAPGMSDPDSVESVHELESPGNTRDIVIKDRTNSIVPSAVTDYLDAGEEISEFKSPESKKRIALKEPSDSPPPATDPTGKVRSPQKVQVIEISTTDEYDWETNGVAVAAPELASSDFSGSDYQEAESGNGWPVTGNSIDNAIDISSGEESEKDSAGLLFLPKTETQEPEYIDIVDETPNETVAFTTLTTRPYQAPVLWIGLAWKSPKQ
jgi:hypothetical protein